MKKTAAFFLCFCLLAVHAASAAASGPQWTGYSEGLDLARQTNRNVMVMFYSDTCKYCTLMDEKTYAAKPVIDYLDKYYVSIRINAPKTPDLSEDYDVRGYPTIWFLTPDGEKITPLPGYVPPDQFLPVLHFIQTKAYTRMSFPDFVKKEFKN